MRKNIPTTVPGTAGTGLQNLSRNVPGTEKGFTLTELLITAGVVAVVVLGFVGASYGIQMQTEAAYQRAIALQDANQVMEQMRNAASTGTWFTNVTTTYNGTLSGYNNLPSETVTVGHPVVGTILEPVVTVTYLENSRRTTSVALRTILTQKS